MADFCVVKFPIEAQQRIFVQKTSHIPFIFCDSAESPQNGQFLILVFMLLSNFEKISQQIPIPFSPWQF